MLRQSERKTTMFCNLGTAYYSVSCNPGAAVIMHTPRACSHLAFEGHWMIRRRAYLREPSLVLPDGNCLFVTGITDKEAIFGGEKILRQCLVDVSRLPWVRYMVVVSGCTAGVIGDDVASVCQEVEEETGVPVLLVPGAGFMSKHHVETQVDLLTLLLDRFSGKELAEKQENLAVLFGENRGTANENNIAEITRLLSLFGFTKVLFPPNCMTVEDFQDIPKASLFMAVGFSMDHFNVMQDFTRAMAERYHAPCYLGNYPIGESGTRRFVKELGALLGKEGEAEKIMEGEEKRLAAVAETTGKALYGKKLALVLGFPLRFCRIENHLFTLMKAGMVPSVIILHNDLTSREKEEQVCHIRSFRELADIPIIDGEEKVRDYEKSVDLILTTTPMDGVSHQLGISVQQVGMGGVENLLEKAKASMADGGRRVIYEF